MANVIREDVIKVEYDVNDGGLSASIKLLESFKDELFKGFMGLSESVNELKRSFNGFETSGLDDIKSSAENVQETIKGLESGVKNVKEEFSADIDTSVIDGVKKSTEQTTESVKKFSEITKYIEKFDSRVENLKKHFDSLRKSIKSFGSAIAHPLNTAKTGLSNIKKEISEAVSKIQNTGKTKLSDLTKNVKDMYSTLSRGQTGAKGFVTALKSIGKVGFEKTISGFQSIKKSIKNISFSSIKSGLSSIGSGINSALTGITKFGSGVQKVTSKIKSAFGSIGSKIKNFAGDLSNAADTITSKIFNIKSLIAGVATGALVQNSIGIVVDRQNITSQFEVLLGSAEKAQERVNELTDFAGMTPFTRDEIFAASKQLQVFTEDALSTGDSLRIIGDVAAGTGQPFEDVALWTGRLYDAMKAGRPVGEMTSRLQEMGAISGEDRSKLEELAESGEDITHIWPSVEKIFSRYDGTMEKLSNNLGNMLTSLKSFAANSIFMPIGEGKASGLQPAIQRFREFRKKHKEDITAMGEVLNNFASKICVPLFNKIEQGAEFAVMAIASLKDGLGGLNNLKGKSPILDKLIGAVNYVINHKETFMGAVKGIAGALGGITAAGKFTKIISGLTSMLNPISLVATAFGLLFAALKSDSENGGTALTSLKDVAVLVFDSIKNTISILTGIISQNKGMFEEILQTIIGLLPPLAEALGEVLIAGLDLATVALPVLLDVFKSLFDAVKPLLEQLPEFIGFIADIIKSCAKAEVIENLVKLFLAYKSAMVLTNGVIKLQKGLLVLLKGTITLVNGVVKLATGAQKLWNAAMNKCPILLLVTGAAALVGGLVSLAKKFSESDKEVSPLSKHIEEVTGNINCMREAFDNAEVNLPDYGSLISYKGNALGDIDQQIADKEKQITEAITEAIKDQKGARDEDLRNIRGYIDELEGLESEKVSVYLDQQETQFIKLSNELQYGDYDQQEVANLLAEADELWALSKDSINEEAARQEASNSKYYQTVKDSIVKNEKLVGEARNQALNAAYNENQKRIKEIDKERIDQLNESKKLYENVYKLGVDRTEKFAQSTNFDFEVLKGLTDTYQTDFKYLEDCQNGFVGNSEKTMNSAVNKVADSTQQVANYTSRMDKETIESTNRRLLMMNEAKNKNVELSKESLNSLGDILKAVEDMPAETQDSGRMIMKGLMTGMKDEEGNLIDTTNMTCEQLIETARTIFDIHSPSKVFAEMGMYIGLGLVEGLTQVTPVLITSVTAIMMGLVNSADGFNLDTVTQCAGDMSASVIDSFTQMGLSVSADLSEMQNTVILSVKIITTAVITDFTLMNVRVVTIAGLMAVNVVSAMSRMKSEIDGLDLYSSGINIMDGLINGMESKRTVLVSTARSIAQSVKSTMDNALDIHSPSRELFKTGMYTGQGQIEGMKSTLPEIQHTADKMGQSAIPDNDGYTPSSSYTTYNRSSSSENVVYSPTFNLTISGTSEDRSMARKVKKWVAEAIDESYSSFESKSSVVREV